MKSIINDWTTYLEKFWIAKKAVKITPFPYDDILLDIVCSGIKKVIRK